MQENNDFVIVIGASAGGMRAIGTVLSALPVDIPAAIVVVIHLPRSEKGQMFLSRLQRETDMPCHLAGDDMPLRTGHVYFAPANYHTLIRKGMITLGKGPPEGNWRPSIDTTMRSAAVAFDSQCIGIILTGMLDDGTAGMEAVKRCGGYTLVQDPNEADYPDMPLSVLRSVEPDGCLTLSAIPAAILNYLQDSPEPAPIPEDLRLESNISERVATTVENLPALGTHSVYSCPQCGGGLWELKNGDITRFRCHIGHSFTGNELLSGQENSIDQTLWVALRIMEERHKLLTSIAAREEQQGLRALSGDHYSRAEELNQHIGRLKEIIYGLQEIENE